MKKMINHLGSTLDKQSQMFIPYQQTLQKLQQFTEQIQQIWQVALPDDLLKQLMVIYYDEQSMTISVPSPTVANHLNYTSQPLLVLLQETQLPAFLQLKNLKFHYLMLPNTTQKYLDHLADNVNQKKTKFCELSDATRQNIAQLADFVIHDKPLSDALRKLSQS